MMLERDWPALQRSLVLFFNQDAELGPAGTESPADVEKQDIFTRITNPSNLDDGRELSAVLDFDVFSHDWHAAHAHARLVRRRVLAMKNRTIVGSRIDTVETASGPTETGGTDQATRFLYSARFVLRRQQI